KLLSKASSGKKKIRREKVQASKLEKKQANLESTGRALLFVEEPRASSAAQNIENATMKKLTNS
ncbi:hypothetical protein CK204_27190, partial [Klebsiella pneumoniae]